MRIYLKDVTTIVLFTKISFIKQRSSIFFLVYLVSNTLFLNKQLNMTRKFVVKAFGKLLKIKETKSNFDDVIIYVGEEPNFKEFHAYSKILCSKSDYFNKILSD